MKRVLRPLCIIILIILLLFTGLFAAKKLHSMYRNIWSVLDTLSSAAGQVHAADLAAMSRTIDTLESELDALRTQVDHLHRQAFSDSTGYDYSWADSAPPYIAHACGGIDGATYTNSREAFIRNYELGQRVFEIDFNLAQDGILISSHDEETWRRMTGSDLPYTSVHFNQQPLLGGYESLSISDVIELMAAYPDAYVVTDTKAVAKEEVLLAFSQLVHCAQQTHPEVLDRIIPQIYHQEMLSWVSSVYPFRSVIFTLYQLRWTAEDILDFCMNSGVRFITLPQDQVQEDVLRLWDTLDIRVAVHTINEPQDAASLFYMGVDMVYTDFLTPAGS